MSKSGRDALQNVREWWKAFTDSREWSGCPPGFLGVVRRPSRMSGSGRESLLDVQKWSGDPPKFL